MFTASAELVPKVPEADAAGVDFCPRLGLMSPGSVGTYSSESHVSSDAAGATIGKSGCADGSGVNEDVGDGLALPEVELVTIDDIAEAAVFSKFFGCRGQHRP